VVYARRDLFKLGLSSASVAAGVTLLPGMGEAQGYFGARGFWGAPGGFGPREVAVHNLHTGESLSAIYFDRGEYVPDALSAMNHVMRDFRTGEVHEMRPELFDLWHTIRDVTGSRQPFQIISGYRSPKTNEMLHEATIGVAQNSFHMKGMASDVRLEDVELSHLHAAALAIGRGGVGYYPSSDFVHVDVGPVRHWG
jgi:uncharacterized protein YcbK (DUF882 family)